jgi:hypothetical protein
MERTLIKQFAPVYNQTNGGEITKGKRISREVVERIKMKNCGLKRTPEQNAAMGIIKKGQYASDPSLVERMRVHLEVQRKKIDQAKRVAAVKKSHETRVWSDASRAKLSASCMGRRYSREIIEKASQKKRKQVECVTLNTAFDSITDAAAATGVCICNISRVCRSKRGTAGGMLFKFA